MVEILCGSVPGPGGTPGRGSPPDLELPIITVGRFDPRASIVIIGQARTGKSTLAVIACAALGRRLIDFYAFVQQRTGIRRRDSDPEDQGSAECKSREPELLQELLLASDRDHIIVVPSACVAHPASQRLIRDFAQSHPVIHIASDLKSCTNPPPPPPPEADVLPGSGNASYRSGQSCSNYEYYNLFEGSTDASRKSLGHGLNNSTIAAYSFGSSFLRLKRVEQDFLRFLGSVLATRRHGFLSGMMEKDYPLPAQTPFTCALSLTPCELLEAKNLEGMLCDGADAVEIGISPDYDDSLAGSSHTSDLFEIVSHSFTAVRRVFTGPILYHVVKPNRSRRSSGSELRHDESREAMYLDLLCHGLRLCSDYLTVDLSCDDNIIRKIVASRGPTQIIGHYHDSAPGSDGWSHPDRMDKYIRARSLGCRIVRLTQVAESEVDNLGARHFAHRVEASGYAQPELIAYNTGLLGRTSCCFNPIFTPVSPSLPLTIRSSGPAPSDHTSLLALKEIQTALYASFVLNKMHLYIIGTDVSSSLSPPMYQTAFRHLGLPHTFVPRGMASIREVEDFIKDDNFGGASIAQGFKVSVLPYTPYISHHAKMIGAVNTLIPIRCAWEGRSTPPLEFWRQRNRSGPVKGLYGENTDWIGIHRSIAKRLSPVNAIGPRTTGLVMGAGGMARAAVYAMIQLGVRHVFLTNRTIRNAYALADHYNGQTVGQNGVPDESNTDTLNFSKRTSVGSARVHVIESLADPWPQGFAQPTMIVCCIRAPVKIHATQPGITIPPQWIKSPNGGVVIDVSVESQTSTIPLLYICTHIYIFFMLTHYVHTDLLRAFTKPLNPSNAQRSP